MAPDKQESVTNSLRWAGNSFLLDSLFEQSPLELFVLDEKLTIVKISHFLAYQMQGMTTQELVGQPLVKLIGQRAFQQVRKKFAQALVGEFIHDHHIVLSETVQRPKQRHYLLTIYPLPEIKEGKLVGGLFQEVTKQYEAEDQLLSYQNRLEMAQNAGGVGLFEWDFETNEVWSSPEEIALFELTNNEQHGELEHWLNRIHPEDKGRILDLIEKSSEEHLPFDTEFRIVLSNNRVKWIRGKGKFYYNEKGEAVQLVGVNYDISRRKREELFLQLKADASRILVSSLSAEVALKQMCELSTKYVADWCGVDLFHEEILGHVAFSRRENEATVFDPKKVNAQSTLGLKELYLKVIESKKPLVISSLTELPEIAKSSFKTLSQLQKQIHLSSALIVPLITHDQPVGVISFFLSNTHDQYGDGDKLLSEQLANRISLYIENFRLYNQIKAERRRLLKLFENVPCIVFESVGVVGKQTYQTTFINAYAQEMLGYPIKNWLTIPNFSMSIIHPEDKQRILEESQLAIGRKETGLVRFRFKAKNGEYIWVESRFTPITNEKDEIVGLRGVVTDISERMELEERKDEFIASASHELKTPLTSLKVFTQVLRSLADEHTQPKSVKYLNRMEKEVDRLTELVYDLLDLSKIQRGQLSLNKKRMSLPALLEEIVQNLQPTISQKIELKKLSRISIYTDEQRLNQVFTNLISNAAKYSPDTSTIHIEMTLKDKKIQVSVRDEGIGIAPEYQERIFQRFYRVFDEKDKTYPGLGMGLFISKTIVEQHGGSIWLTSEPQKGSTFFVSLPIRARKEKS